MERGDAKLLWSKIYLSKKREDRVAKYRRGETQRKRKSKHFVHCCLQALCLTETKQTTYRKIVCLFPVRNTLLNILAKATRQWESTTTVCILVIWARWAFAFCRVALVGRETFSVQGKQRSQSLYDCYTWSLLQKPCNVSIAWWCLQVQAPTAS